MKKIAVIGSSDDRKSWQSVKNGENELLFFENADIPDGADVVIISQRFAGSRLAEMISSLKEKALVAVAAADSSCENQEHLLGLGADDVIFLPLCRELLERKLSELAKRTRLSGTGTSIDFSSFSNIAGNNKGIGSFIVQESDFENIYLFVLRVLERLDQHAQMMIFTISCRGNSIVEPEILHMFTSVVQHCLRRGDISSIHGNQLIVMLMGADENGGRLAAERIVDTFYGRCSDDAYDISFEVQEIKP